MGIVISSRSWLFGSARLICCGGHHRDRGQRGRRRREPRTPRTHGNPSVTVDLSVIDEQGAGPALRSLARPGGLADAETRGVSPIRIARTGAEPFPLRDPASATAGQSLRRRDRSGQRRPFGRWRWPIRCPPPDRKTTPAADPRGDIASTRPPEAVAATATASEASDRNRVHVAAQARNARERPARPERAQPAGLPPPAAAGSRRQHGTGHGHARRRRANGLASAGIARRAGGASLPATTGRECGRCCRFSSKPAKRH